MSMDPSTPGRREPPRVNASWDMMVLRACERCWHLASSGSYYLMMKREIAWDCKLEKAVPCSLDLGNTSDPNETVPMDEHTEGSSI